MAGRHEYSDDEAAADRAMILDALAALSDDARERLRRATDAVEAPGSGPAVEWVSEKGFMPYVSELPVVQELREALYDAGLVVPFNWPQWTISLEPRSELPIDDPVSAVGTITAIVRGDRFSEGSLLGYIESGLLTKAIRVVLSSQQER